MMQSLIENFTTGKMIRSNAYAFSGQKNYHREKENDPRHDLSSAGIGVVLQNDAQLEGEVPKQIDQFKLTKYLSLEWQLEKVFMMNTENLKKFLFLDIVTADERSASNRVPQAWYCIDLSKMLCEGNDWVVWKVDPKVKKMPENSLFPSMCVALGSVIYIFGGHGNNYHEEISVHMYYLDTSNPENEWLEGPSMNVGGVVGSAVVHERKIYVFGRFVEFTENKPCTGKVYDPVLNSWEPLGDLVMKLEKIEEEMEDEMEEEMEDEMEEEMEDEMEEEMEEEMEDKFSYIPIKLDGMQGKFVGSYDDRKILVHTCLWGKLYAYDVVDKSWKVLDNRFGCWDCHGVIMDDVLYVFQQLSGEMCGYDLVQFKWLKPINLDQWFPRIEDSEVGVFREVFFFEVEANVLCLVYFNQTGKEGLDIYCRTFTIKKIMQEDGDVVLEAEVFSSNIYKVGKRGRCLNYVVM